MGEPYRYCLISEWVADEEPCLRLAAWRIEGFRIETGEPLELCNFHAEPFLTYGHNPAG